MKHKKNKSGMPVIILLLGVALIVVGSVFATSYLYTKEKYAGSNKAYSYSLIRKLDENSSDYKTAKKFYSEEEWNAIRNNKLNITEDTNGPDKIDENGIEIKHVYGTTYQGYLMLVHNPEDISVAVNPYLGTSQGAPELETYVSMYNAVAGINGGGFEDAGGTGNGSIPQGVVIHNGELVYGPKDTYVSLVGIDKENHLICAGATANEALSWGIQEAVTFGPIFINNYNVVYKEGSDNLGMLNPRTAIGQRSDGTFMLLVVDGRGPTSFGALYEDIIKIFQDNDAVMAANLDGGNSSAMIYDGEYVNTPVSLYGSRNLPTVFLVKGGN